MKDLQRRGKRPRSVGIGEEAGKWLESFDSRQAASIVRCVSKIVHFADKNYAKFFQGCGLYVVGSSLRMGECNDIDLVLVGLDFRAVVNYNKIFLMDPKALIEAGFLGEPQEFFIERNSALCNTDVLKPISRMMDSENGAISDHAYCLQGMMYDGKVYDYIGNPTRGASMTLAGECSNYAWPSTLIEALCQQLGVDISADVNISIDDEIHRKVTRPFCNYGFGGQQAFLVHRIRVEDFSENPDGDYPVALNTLQLKPIDVCVHAENLRREAWERHQRDLDLPYLRLFAWDDDPNAERKIITHQEYPEFIDPNGEERAKRHKMFEASYKPDGGWISEC